MSFHQSMESALNLALENLQTLQAADPVIKNLNENMQFYVKYIYVC